MKVDEVIESRTSATQRPKVARSAVEEGKRGAHQRLTTPFLMTCGCSDNHRHEFISAVQKFLMTCGCSDNHRHIAKGICLSERLCMLRLVTPTPEDAVRPFSH